MKNLYYYTLGIVFILIVFTIACKKTPKDKEPISKEIVKEVHLGDTIKVNFPKGSILATEVSLKTVNDKAILDLFNETAIFYKINKILPYQIALNIAKDAPQNDSIAITVKLPATFKTLLPAKHGFQLFAQAIQESSFEIIDSFYQIPSNYNPTTGELTATLSRELFTNQRSTAKTYEAILIIGTTPGENLISSSSTKNKAMGNSVAATSGCNASQITCPLGSLDKCNTFLSLDDLFGPRYDPLHRTVLKNHRGVDYRVATGTPIYAVSDGTIEIVKTSSSYGKIIFVRHKDNTATLYAHLSEQSVANGQSVKKGQLLGKTGATGSRVTGPHLHFEYYAEGEKYAQSGQIDPTPCVSSGNIDGNITIRDNGNLADDAFEIYLDNSFLGTTEIGQSNSVAASNLKPGTKSLTLKCTVAPDNVGTYEVILNNGITFSSGGVLKEGTIAQGQSVTWQIIIPQKLNGTSNLLLRKTNAVKEK